MDQRTGRLATAFSLIAAILLATTRTATAEAPSLGLPIDCRPGETCWIVNYVDHDPTDGVRDYACGIATYNMAPRNAHSGTDISIGDLEAMRRGVAVLAAAPGRVVGTRDGIADVSVDKTGAAAVAKQECGNGVRIDHGDGWFTQYCHMRNGSITVHTGDVVTAGQKLGLVGLSGMTEFPHLHFQVEKNSAIIDPFVGEHRAAQCGLGKDPLWRPDVLASLPYQPTALDLAGFSAGEPSVDMIRDGEMDPLQWSPSAPAMVLWVDMFNVRAGDVLTMAIRGPDGAVFDHTQTLPKNQARRFVFGGRKSPAQGWARGTYTGEIRLSRTQGPNGPETLVATRSIEVH